MADHEETDQEHENGDDYGDRIVTSTISARNGNGRDIYVYLRQCDSLEFRDLARSKGESTWIRVKVDMEGHRHWQIKLAPEDSLGTGDPVHPPPPPPPPPPNGDE